MYLKKKIIYLVILIFFSFSFCNYKNNSDDSISYSLQKQERLRKEKELENPKIIPEYLKEICVEDNKNDIGRDPDSTVWIPSNKDIVIKRVSKNKKEVKECIKRNITFLKKNLKNIYQDQLGDYYLIMKKLKPVNPSNLTLSFIKKEIQKLEELNKKNIFHNDIHPENIKMDNFNLILIDPNDVADHNSPFIDAYDPDEKKFRNPLYNNIELIKSNKDPKYSRKINKDKLAFIKSLFFMYNEEKLKNHYKEEKLDMYIFQKIFTDIIKESFEKTMEKVLGRDLRNPINSFLMEEIKKYGF
ncbi:MAG: hypothetical protein GY830_05880 [Bacteroidetes bacterium]|nr:hypothetical protein [Bacteroidota bacterium]